MKELETRSALRGEFMRTESSQHEMLSNNDKRYQFEPGSHRRNKIRTIDGNSFKKVRSYAATSTRNFEVNS